LSARAPQRVSLFNPARSAGHGSMRSDVADRFSSRIGTAHKGPCPPGVRRAFWRALSPAVCSLGARPSGEAKVLLRLCHFLFWECDPRPIARGREGFPYAINEGLLICLSAPLEISIGTAGERVLIVWWA